MTPFSSEMQPPPGSKVASTLGCPPRGSGSWAPQGSPIPCHPANSGSVNRTAASSVLGTFQPVFHYLYSLKLLLEKYYHSPFKKRGK